MELKVFKALWGMTGTLAENLDLIAANGYDGVDAWIWEGAPTASELIAQTEIRGLRRVAATIIETVDAVGPTLRKLAEYDPVRINIHSGRDSMTRDEGCAFFEAALKVEAEIGVPVVHETHRGRLLYSPWEANFYLCTFDVLHVNADYSHWVNVCERTLDDTVMALPNQRARYIHGRVGYEHGPQAPDPAAPEYAEQLAWHEKQWQAIWDQQAQAGESELFFTPEYGPQPYLHTLPYTNVPVADLWQICLWAKDRARQTFG
jgi:hypothetical protein